MHWMGRVKVGNNTKFIHPHGIDGDDDDDDDGGGGVVIPHKSKS